MTSLTTLHSQSLVAGSHFIAANSMGSVSSGVSRSDSTDRMELQQLVSDEDLALSLRRKT